MDSRKQFEEWVLENNNRADLSLCRDEDGFRFSVGEYKNETLQISWIAWQHSRDFAVKALRAKEENQWMGSRGYHSGWLGAAKFIEEAK